MAIGEGDTVQLNCAGPLMTVEAVTGTQCQCQWFTGPKMDKLQSGTLPMESLSKVDPNAYHEIGISVM